MGTAAAGRARALVVVRPDGGYGGDDTEVDLRVDDHPAPVAELRRLLELHRLYFGKPDPATLLPLEGEVAAEVARRLGALGYRTLEDWAGVENYEERMVDGAIDPLVLDKLRAASGEMSVLAIDAGTTGRHRLVVDEEAPGRRPRLRGVPAALPAARLGRARAGGDLAGDAVGRAAGADAATSEVTRRRDHQPARDRGALGPATPSPRPRRAVVWQDRRRAAVCDRLRDAGHEDRVRELTGLASTPTSPAPS